MRAAFPVSAAVLAAVGGYAAVRVVAVPTRDAWALIGADGDGAIAYARLSVADTGLLDRQLTTRFLLLPALGNPIEDRAMNGPAVLDDGGVVGGTDALRESGGAWDLRIGGDGLGARIHVTGAAPTCPPAVGVMGGMVEDRVDGRLLSGPAIVTRTHAAGHIDDTALYVFGEGFAAGIDPLSACPAWVRAGDQAWTGTAAPFEASPGVVLTLGGWSIKLRAVGEAVDQDAWAHALVGERLLASVFGQPAPHVEARHVLARVDGPRVGVLAPGLALRRL